MLTSSIAALNTSTTFSPLQPLLDTDVAGYLRHAHEQTLISTIEEGRRETEAEFYHVLEERVRRDWEMRKKRVFEELGGRGFGVEAGRSTSDLRQSGRGNLNVSVCWVHPNLPQVTHILPFSFRRRPSLPVFRCTKK
jgi:nuclear pore complex protein Nup93